MLIWIKTPVALKIERPEDLPRLKEFMEENKIKIPVKLSNLLYTIINPAIRSFVFHYSLYIFLKKLITLSVILHSIGKASSMRS